MRFLWFKKKKKAKRRMSASARHYEAHKEHARILVHERLSYWNQFYNFTYKRVAIRNQRSRWGSCSTKQNLNFNYRLVFIPIDLVDYVIVHELCHLKHFNHGPEFWSAVEEKIPDYTKRKAELHHATKNFHLIQHTVGVRPLPELQQIREISATVSVS